MADEQNSEDYIEIKIPDQEQKPKVVPTKPVVKPAAKQKKTVKKTLKKKTAKKTTKKTLKRRPVKSEPTNNWLWIVLLIIGLAVIAAVIYLSLQAPTLPTEETGAQEQQVVALVNNNPIYMHEVDALYDKLPENIKAQTSKDIILDQLIDQEVLIQEANNQGIFVTNEELAEYTAELLSQFGMAIEDLDATLEKEGVTREEFDRNT